MDFANLIDVFIGNVEKHNSMITVGIVPKEDIVCKNTMVLMAYSMKVLYEDEDVTDETKMNIESIYNRLIPIGV